MKRHSVLPYLQIARPDHWFKNIFILPGVAVAALLGDGMPTGAWSALPLALLTASLAASANYTLNEILDAESDKYHPTKRNRPIPSGLVTIGFARIQYVLLCAIALCLAYPLGELFLTTTAVFLGLGVAYNVRPMRTKDRVYLDVVSESANNAVRLTLGWAVVAPEMLPPMSIVLVFWFGGAYLMTVKRYAEYRQIDDPQVAAKYRQSFKLYSEESLILSALFYAMNTAFFIAVFLLKYRIEFLISFPLISLMFAWYLAIGMQPESVAQTPERLYRHPKFLGFVAVVVGVLVLLFLVDVELLNVLLEPVRP